MCYINRGHPQLSLQAGNFCTHLHAQLGIEVRQGLIHQKGRRFPHHRAPHGDPLALSARQCRRLTVEQRLQLQGLCYFTDALRALGLALSRKLHREGYVLEHSHMRIQGIILKDHRNIPVLRRQILYILSTNAQGSAADLLQPRDHAQGCRFSASRRANENEELAIVYRQAKILDCLEFRPVGLANFVQHNNSHVTSSSYQRYLNIGSRRLADTPRSRTAAISLNRYGHRRIFFRHPRETGVVIWQSHAAAPARYRDRGRGSCVNCAGDRLLSLCKGKGIGAMKTIPGAGRVHCPDLVGRNVPQKRHRPFAGRRLLDRHRLARPQSGHLTTACAGSPSPRSRQYRFAQIPGAVPSDLTGGSIVRSQVRSSIQYRPPPPDPACGHEQRSCQPAWRNRRSAVPGLAQGHCRPARRRSRAAHHHHRR